MKRWCSNCKALVEERAYTIQRGLPVFDHVGRCVTCHGELTDLPEVLMPNGKKGFLCPNCGAEFATPSPLSYSSDWVYFSQRLCPKCRSPLFGPLNVKSYQHPALGPILTDINEMTLYYFSPDKPDSNPLYSGATWPYVPLTNPPKADLGITATLGTSNYGQIGMLYLTIDALPTYTYSGDLQPGDAIGHGSGSVWWTVRPNGAINQ